jgi:hypothetical protein
VHVTRLALIILVFSSSLVHPLPVTAQDANCSPDFFHNDSCCYSLLPDR